MRGFAVASIALLLLGTVAWAEAGAKEEIAQAAHEWVQAWLAAT